MVQHLTARSQGSRRSSALAPGDVVLDIGSNDGTLAQRVRDARACAASASIPTRERFAAYYPRDVEVVADFFSAATPPERERRDPPG